MALSRDAWHVHENLDRLGGLEHIHGRGALAGRIADGIVVEKASKADVLFDAAGVVDPPISGSVRHAARIVARAHQGLAPAQIWLPHRPVEVPNAVTRNAWGDRTDWQ